MATTAPARQAELAGYDVNRIGYGAMQLEHADRDAAIALLRRAVELGVDHIDTAAFYGHGTVNGLLRDALHPYQDVVLVSKIGAVRRPDGLVAAQRPAELRAAVITNLRELGLDTVPVVNLRRTDRAPGIVATGEQLVDLDSQLAELSAMRDEGLIGAIGLSQASPEQVRAALPAGIVCVQNLYNVLERDDEPTLDVCADAGIAYVPYFPLGSGFAGRSNVRADPTVNEVAAALSVTPSQVGMAWLLAHSPATLVIAGTRDERHLAENLEAAQVRLDADALATLDALAVRQ